MDMARAMGGHGGGAAVATWRAEGCVPGNGEGRAVVQRLTTSTGPRAVLERIHCKRSEKHSKAPARVSQC